jgi:hypothetical protein
VHIYMYVCMYVCMYTSIHTCGRWQVDLIESGNLFLFIFKFTDGM